VGDFWIFFKKTLSKVSDDPIGELSPNLVTLEGNSNKKTMLLASVEIIEIIHLEVENSSVWKGEKNPPSAADWLLDPTGL
jgi:hypothetical protein